LDAATIAPQPLTLLLRSLWGIGEELGEDDCLLVIGEHLFHYQTKT